MRPTSAPGAAAVAQALQNRRTLTLASVARKPRTWLRGERGCPRSSRARRCFRRHGGVSLPPPDPSRCTLPERLGRAQVRLQVSPPPRSDPRLAQANSRANRQKRRKGTEAARTQTAEGPRLAWRTAPRDHQGLAEGVACGADRASVVRRQRVHHCRWARVFKKLCCQPATSRNYISQHTLQRRLTFVRSC